MSCCNCDNDLHPSCDPGQRPEQAFWRPVILDAVGDPVNGPRANVVFERSPPNNNHFLNVPVSEDCFNGTVNDLTQLFPAGPNFTFPPLSLKWPTYRYGSKTFTYRCRDIDTNPNNKGDASTGDLGEQNYDLPWESTEVLEDGSRKWIYAKRDWDIFPRNLSFDPTTAFDEFGFHLTGEVAIGTMVFTIFERPQLVAEFLPQYAPYLLTEDEPGIVIEDDIRDRVRVKIDTEASIIRNRDILWITGVNVGERRRVINYLDGVVELLGRLPRTPEVGDEFVLLKDEFMHSCFLDFRVNGALYYLANPSAGAANYHHERAIEYNSHMLFYRRYKDARWYAASARSCCEPRQIDSTVSIRRHDPPEPLEVTQGVAKSFLFESGSWPDLSPYRVDGTVNGEELLATTTEFAVDLEPSPFPGVGYVGKQLRFTSSGLLAGLRRTITGYADGVVTIDEETPLPSPPANGTKFVVSDMLFVLFANVQIVNHGSILVAGDPAVEALNQQVIFDLSEEDTELLESNVTEGAIDNSLADATTTSFKTNLNANLDTVDGQYDGQELRITSGPLKGRIREIDRYVVEQGVGIVTFDWPLDVVPEDGVTLEVWDDLYRWQLLRPGNSVAFKEGTLVVFEGNEEDA